ncbi:Zinc finger C2H2-type [Sesbania bispinosa]|nr:Zinc finger C2H2-type [Sesbania bispinosa]
MKRQRDMGERLEIESIDLANCLMLLSHPPQESKKKPHRKSFGPVEFECKTCNRKFPSFQALGGHRASHKRSKLDGDEDLKAHATSLSLGNKPKTHECSICGQEFSLGQALGGHMRRHRAAINEEFSSIKPVAVKVPVFNGSNNRSTGVMCLDLNLTPLQNDLKLLFGNMAPNVDVLV